MVDARASCRANLATIAFSRESGLTQDLRLAYPRRPSHDIFRNVGRFADENGAHVRIWSNTSTLAGYVDDLAMNAEPHLAEFAVVGGKAWNVDDFPQLCGVFKCGIGLDNLDRNRLRERNIELHLPSERTMDVICDETASFTCHAILHAIYRETGDFATWHKVARRSARETRLLIVGHGRIGRRVAERMRAFMSVEIYDQSTHERSELIGALRRSQIVSLHVPLTASSQGLIGAAELAALPHDATLINTARGGVVDEEALAVAIAQERLYAHLDVFSREPYKGPLLPSSRLILTPHVASTSSGFLRGLAKDLLQAVERTASAQAKAKPVDQGERETKSA